MADLLPSTPDTSAAEESDPRVVGLDDEDADELLSALSSATARELLATLHEDPAPPSQLAETVDTSLQNAQYHLGNLEEAGVVEVIDTAYSEKGREMDVYAPTDRPLVVVAGNEDDDGGASLKTAISRFLGGLGILSIASLVVEGLAGEWSPRAGGDRADAGSAPVDDEDDAEAADAPAHGDPADEEVDESGGADAAAEEETGGDDAMDDGGGDDTTDDGGMADDDGGMTDDGRSDDTADDGGMTDGDGGGDDMADDGGMSDDDGLEEDDLDESRDDSEPFSSDEDGYDGTEDGGTDDEAADEDGGDAADGEIDAPQADGVEDADPVDAPIGLEYLGDGSDEALGLPPGFLFFLGGALVLSFTFARWYWRAYR